MVREHQKGDSDCHSLTQWGNETATPRPDELKASNQSMRVLAQNLQRIAEGDEMLVYREVNNGTNRVIVHTNA